MSEDIMRITPLGSGQEVGRSCHLLQFRNTTLLLDCGIHPGYDGLNGLPFFDEVNPAEVDVLLITHFHLDHAASLPHFTERTKFKGRIFMTHPTKAVIRLLLGDYLRLMNMKHSQSGGGDGNADDPNGDVLYTEAELQSCVDKVELIDYHQTISLSNGLKFHALNAGHVLGAAMFLIEFGGGRTVLYTGDYSMEEDRHLMAAEIPTVQPDVLICESTYGIQVHDKREVRESRFTSTVEQVVNRGGRCLIPVFALGRAQELLLILDEYWRENPQLQSVPIYYASKMASRALRVYQTYANMMNARIRALMDVGNPFHFDHIQNLKSIDVNAFVDSGPSVVFASPGMLQSGVSRQLFDRWASDPKNGCLIAGYAVENTLAREIMLHPEEVVTMEGRKQPLNCLVEYVSFSAHVDFLQNRDFIERVNPKHIILVHGQKDEMGRLKNALTLRYRSLPENKRPSIRMPENTKGLSIKFPRRRSAKVMGTLANRNNINDEPQQGEAVKGILVTQNFQSKIVAPEDLSTYTPLRLGSLSSKLHVPFMGQVDTLRLFLNEMFSGVSEEEVTNSNKEGGQDSVIGTSNPSAVDETDTGNGQKVTVFGLHEKTVTVTMGETKGIATVEWKATSIGDILADSVVALLMHAQSSAASIRLTSQPCSHSRPNAAAAADDNDGKATIIEDEGPATKKLKESNDGRDGTAPSGNMSRMETVFRMFHKTLNQQYDDVEATYDARKVSFEIQSDTGLEVKKAVDGENVTCTVTIEFEDDVSTDARISVECVDPKLASNIQECLRSIAKSTAPIELR